jgi:hypothetical protein
VSQPQALQIPYDADAVIDALGDRVGKLTADNARLADVVKRLAAENRQLADQLKTLQSQGFTPAPHLNGSHAPATPAPAEPTPRDSQRPA